VLAYHGSQIDDDCAVWDTYMRSKVSKNINNNHVEDTYLHLGAGRMGCSQQGSFSVNMVEVRERNGEEI